MPTMPSLQNASGLPFNVKLNQEKFSLPHLNAAANDPLALQVSSANNKILYEDPLEKKRRERQQRID